MILVNGAVGTSLTPGSNTAARASDRSPRELDAPDIRHQLGLAVAAAALVAGLAYVAISAYWALGGTWLLATVSSSLVTADHRTTVVMAVWAAVVLKGIGALLPFYLRRPAPPSKWHGRLRLLAWAEGAVLTLYGFVFTSAVYWYKPASSIRGGPPTGALWSGTPTSGIRGSSSGASSWSSPLH